MARPIKETPILYGEDARRIITVDVYAAAIPFCFKTALFPSMKRMPTSLPDCYTSTSTIWTKIDFSAVTA